jgi:hypothetical protein
MVPAALATVLFPVIRLEPDQYRDKMLLSLGASLAFGVAVSFFLLFFSTDVLWLFSPVYAEIGGTSLQLLGFGLIGLVLKFHVCTGARLRNSMREASFWFCAGGLFELTCAVVGCQIGGLEGLVVGWVLGVTIEGTIMLLAAVFVARWTRAEPAGHLNPAEPAS